MTKKSTQHTNLPAAAETIIYVVFLHQLEKNLNSSKQLKTLEKLGCTIWLLEERNICFVLKVTLSVFHLEAVDFDESRVVSSYTKVERRILKDAEIREQIHSSVILTYPHPCTSPQNNCEKKNTLVQSISI